jgi:hypothetical protein
MRYFEISQHHVRLSTSLFCYLFGLYTINKNECTCLWLIYFATCHDLLWLIKNNFDTLGFFIEGRSNQSLAAVSPTSLHHAAARVSHRHNTRGWPWWWWQALVHPSRRVEAGLALEVVTTVTRCARCSPMVAMQSGWIWCQLPDFDSQVDRHVT